jgi:fructose-1,6-bisphosphatase
MKIPNRGKIYSVNEGYESLWDEAVKQYIKNKKYPSVGITIYCFDLLFLIVLIVD